MHETVFILGAGASIPYGFPSGSQLVDIIADRMLGARELDKCEHDSLLVKLLEEHDREALIHFGDSLKASATNSIDSFLSDRREFRDLGKMCIVFTLREYEQKCKVRGALYDSTNTGNWYKYFFNLIKNLEEIKFKIYTFNYDRSLEYYLLRAFEKS